MGKKRITTITEDGAKKKKVKKSVKEEKGIHLPGLKGGERVVAIGADEAVEDPQEEASTEGIKTTKRAKVRKKRGKNYLASRAKIETNRLYSPREAIKLAKETSFARFDGTFEAHLTVVKTGLRGEVELPHPTGKAKKVRVVDEKLLKDLEAGKIDFDILLSTPAMVPQLVKFAKLLGPKGLMPNPKNNTVVEDPKEALKKFSKPLLSYKTEANAPLLHLVIGKASQKDEEIEANLLALIKALEVKNIKKLTLCATMGPGVKVAIDKL